jgi:hypothetical protein
MHGINHAISFQCDYCATAHGRISAERNLPSNQILGTDVDDPIVLKQFEQRTDRSSSSSEGQQHFNPPFDNANRISSKVNLDRIADGLSGADIELTAMQRALDDVGIEPTIRQHRVSMGAYIVGRKDFSSNIVKRDLNVPHLSRCHLSWSNIIEHAERMPFRIRSRYHLSSIHRHRRIRYLGYPGLHEWQTSPVAHSAPKR